MRVPLMVVLIAGTLAGCARLRFVVDAVPAEEALTESEVLRDPGVGVWGGAKVAMMDVSGLIADARRRGLLAPGANPVADFAESLRKAADDAGVKAVLVRVDSPGGTVTASDLMYREVKHFQEETGKPVVMLMSSVAASGGFYLACAGDEIIAYPTTVTGSIGVILQTINVSEGLQRIGVRAESITSGPNKAMGSPWEPMPPEHRELLQGIINEFYEQFLAIVKESRPGISGADMDRITDGRVITGAHAARLGLVDRTGDLRDAFKAAKRLAGLRRARLVKYHRPLEHVASPYALAPGAGVGGTQVNLLQLNLDAGRLLEEPGFFYLWDPTAW